MWGKKDTVPMTASGMAWQRLVAGNRRFTSGNLARKDLSRWRRERLATEGQHPFAAIVSCSDSRVPPELIFDQALGDLFVVRAAGNVVDAVALGSVEYAVEHLHVPLVVVMGHEQCGAVKAAVDGGEAPGSIGKIVKMISPSVEKAQSSCSCKDEVYEKTADENIRAVMAQLLKSHVLREAVERRGLEITGAKYLLCSGEVVFNSPGA